MCTCVEPYLGGKNKPLCTRVEPYFGGKNKPLCTRVKPSNEAISCLLQQSKTAFSFIFNINTMTNSLALKKGLKE